MGSWIPDPCPQGEFRRSMWKKFFDFDKWFFSKNLIGSIDFSLWKDILWFNFISGLFWGALMIAKHCGAFSCLNTSEEEKIPHPWSTATLDFQFSSLPGKTSCHRCIFPVGLLHTPLLRVAKCQGYYGSIRVERCPTTINWSPACLLIFHTCRVADPPAIQY